MSNYDWLLAKLDAFIRRYYANKMLRGTLFFLTCLLLFVLLVSFSEYFFYLPAFVKITLVTIFLFLGATSLIVWVLVPFSKMSKLGKLISHEQAASIIGAHFPEISDKLLNILQLKKSQEPNVSRELIEASIEQKSSQIVVFPIAKAIDFSSNRRYLKYLLPLVVLTIGIFIFYPSVFLDASERLLQPTKTFVKPAPFQFVVENEALQVVRNEDFTLKIKIEGKALPSNVAIQLGNDEIELQSLGKNEFQYTFKNVTDEMPFRLSAAGFFSENMVLKVVQKPILKGVKMVYKFPSYIQRPNETQQSLSDITLPAGTQVSWQIAVDYTQKAQLKLGAALLPIAVNNNEVAFETKVVKDTTYTLELWNNQTKNAQSFQYKIQVVEDQFPVVQMVEFKDSITGKQMVLTGSVGDDYGISKLLFQYEILTDKNQKIASKSVPIKISGNKMSNFEHYFDIETLSLQPGQKVNYYVEAWDNDAINGSKSTRSQTLTYAMFTATQLDSALNANSKQINSSISNTTQQNKQLQSEMRDLQSKLLQSEKLDWEQQQTLQDLMQKQEDIKQNLEKIKERFEEQVKQSQQKQLSENLKEKQQDIQKQLDNILNNELKEQMKKLQELMAKMNKENAFQTMKQLEQDNKLFNMDMERMKDLMKKMEMQMRMEDMANKMEDLAKKENNLKQQTEQQKQSNEALGQEQKKIQNELNNAMKEDMKSIQDLNKDMKQQQELSDVQDEAKDAQQNMQESQDELSQQQNSKAAQKQSKAAQNLQQMAAKMREKASGMDMEQLDIDIKAVRQLLTNLMRLSFDEEQLMVKTKQTPISSAQYLDHIKEQKRLHQNSYMIRDSLFVLSKRLFKLAAQVNKETTELERNMQASLNAMEDRKVSEALTRQQYVMTKTNNLALMLNEMLSNLMQMQSESQDQKSGSCNNPGGKKPKPGSGQQLSDIITKQQSLGNGMQQMQQAMKNKPGQGQQGDGKGKSGSETGEGEGNSEQIARMAQQQAAIRRQLQNLMNSKSGTAIAKELREIQEKMDRTETDLVNRRLTSELLMRQKEILTRLLQTEKAMREQEEDDQRSSKSALEMSKAIPPALQNKLKEYQNMTEFYKTVPPVLKPYYKAMVDEYFNGIGQNNTK